MSEQYLDGLNDKQREAVLHKDGSVLVLAGAGSGKTRVLTARAAHLVRTGEARPGQIMAVTFTNKAARQMLERIRKMLPEGARAGDIWVGTFHGLCNKILRIHSEAAGLPRGFQIMDDSDQHGAVKRLMKASGMSFDSDKFAEMAGKFQRFINRYKEQGVRPSSVIEHESHSGGRMLPTDGIVFEEWVSAYDKYEKQCDREGVVDFSELMLRTCDLLSVNDDIRAEYGERFRHILVDEFQDTNNVQYAWLGLMAGADARFLAVGDDDQSIYGFRGAQVGNMQFFLDDYAKGQIVRLEQNYRSTSRILDTANSIISGNSDRLGKNLWTSGEEGERVAVEEHEDGLKESSHIAFRIKRMIEAGTRPSEIAILYRTNAQSQPFEKGLVGLGIPYRIHGGLRFFDRMEIKHALAYMRLMVNPKDDGAFMRVVNFPPRKLGEKSVSTLVDQARDFGQCLMHQAAEQQSAHGFQVFAERIEAMRLAADGKPFGEVVKLVVEMSGLEAHYIEKSESERLENLGQLVTTGAQFESMHLEEFSQTPTLADFVANATLQGNNDEGMGNDFGESVNLMTIHASKGLEFDDVFVVGVEDSMFPGQRAVAKNNIEEERRLFYVAVTRAKKHLTVSYAERRMIYGETRPTGASMFVKELPAEHIEFKSGIEPVGPDAAEESNLDFVVKRAFPRRF